MGAGLLQAHLDAFDIVGGRIADKRGEGYDKQYEYADAIKGAYGIFFFQHPSILEYQERLKRKNERCNAETIPRVNKIPRANHITRHVDGITSEQFSSVFNAGLQTAQQYGALDQYQVLGRYHLAALDGVMVLLDEGYQKARASIRRRDEFFAGMWIFFNRYVFQTWEDFIGFVGQEDEPDGQWRIAAAPFEYLTIVIQWPGWQNLSYGE